MRQSLKRNYILQIALSVFFFFYGLDMILSHLVTSWQLWILHGINLTVIMGVLLWYLRTSRTEMLTISEKLLPRLQTLLYVIFLSLTVHLVLRLLNPEMTQYVKILNGGVLMITSTLYATVLMKALFEIKG